VCVCVCVCVCLSVCLSGGFLVGYILHANDISLMLSLFQEFHSCPALWGSTAVVPLLCKRKLNCREK
jgi:hypothetical protein